MANSRDTIISYVYNVTGDQDLANTAGLLVKMADSSKLADTEAVALANSLKTLSTQSKAVNDALSQKAGLAETATQLKDAQAALAKYRSETDTTVTSSKKYQTALAAAEKSVTDLTSKQNLQQVALSKTLGGLEKAGVDTTNLAAASASLGTQAATVATSLAKVGTAAITASASTSKIAGAAETVKESFVHVTEGVGEFIKKAGEITGITGIIAGVIAAVSGFKFFEAGAEEATSFDQALGKLRSTSALTSEQMEALKKTIEDVSTSLDETATEGAIGASKLAQAFGDANKAAQALPATLELAKAAQIDVAQAADIVAKSVKGFGLEAAEAGKIADDLATVSVKTGADLGALAATMSQLAPFAKAIGLSFQDTAAILGTLSQKGIDSEQALGGLRGLFEGLRDPTSTLRQELAGLGISTTSFAGIISGLAQAGPKAEAALDSLGTRGKAAILALVQDGGAGINTFRQSLDNTAGAAKTAGDRIEDNLLDAFKDFGNNLKNFAGNALSGALDPIKGAVQSLTEQIKGIPESAGFQAIKQSITDFATSAVASFTELIKSIDFNAVGKSVADFVDSAKSKLSDLGGSIASFGAGAATVANSIGAVFHTVEAAIFGVAAAVAKAVQLTIQGTAALSGNFAALADPASQLNQLVEAFGASAETNFNRASAAGKLAVDNFNAIAGALDKSDASLGKVASSANTAAPALQNAGSSAQVASVHIDGVGQSGENASASLLKLADASNSAARAAAVDAYAKAASDLANLAGSSTTTAAQLDKAQLAAFNAQRALLALGPAAQQASGGVGALDSSFAKLGVQSQKNLDATADAFKNAFDAIDKGSADTAQGLADRQNAFIAYAKAALDAAANIDQAHLDSKKIELDSQASALGLSDALDKVKKSGVDAGKQTSEAFRSVPSDIQAASDAVDHVGQFSDTASRAIKQMGEETGDALNGVTADLSNFSQNAIRAFAEAQDAALQFGIHSEADLQQYVRAIDAANAKINSNINAQKASADALIASFEAMTDSSLKSAAAAGGGLDQLSAELQSVAANAKAGAGQFDLLNDADLSRVQQAAEAAAQRVQEISDAAKQARADLQSIGDSLQDEIDQINGNQDDIEERRFQNQLKQLHDEAEASDLLNSAEYQDAVNKANTLHQLKLKQIADEAQAQKNANNDVANSNPNSPQNSDAFNGPAGSSGRTPQNGDNAPSRGPTNGDNAQPRGPQNGDNVQQNTNNNLTVRPNVVLLTGDAKSVDGLARALLPAIQKLLGNKF